MSRSLALTLTLVIGLGACGGEEASVSGESIIIGAPEDGRVDTEFGAQLIEQGATVIDVRTAEEFATEQIPGAINIDWQEGEGDFAEQVDALTRDAIYVLYCESGRRAAGATEEMLDLGFDSVVNAGGYDELAQLLAS